MSSAPKGYHGWLSHAEASVPLPTTTLAPSEKVILPRVVNLPPSGPCVILAIVSGVIATLSVIVVAHPVSCESAKETRPWALFARLMKNQSVKYLLNIGLSLCAIGFNILATGHGPVAVATPIQVGSNLLSNMLLQWFLGMIRPTKDQVVGTMTLAAAVTLLPDIGPSELDKDSDVLDLLIQPTALLYIALSCVIMASGMLALTKGWVIENDKKLLTYALVGGTATVLSASIGKAVQMIHNLVVLAPLLVVYVALGMVCLVVAAKANATLPDPSTYVPIASGIQLVCTCFAGLFIWGDWARLQYPLGYSMIYVLVVLGTYGVSSFDLLAMYRMEIMEDNAVRFFFKDETLRNVQKDGWPKGDFGPPKGDIIAQQFFKLVRLWNNKSEDRDEYAKIVQRLIRTLVSRSQIRSEDVVQLVVSLLDHYHGLGPSPSPVFSQWMEDHMKPYLDYIYGAAANEKALPLLRKKPSTMPNLLDQQALEALSSPGSPKHACYLDSQYKYMCP